MARKKLFVAAATVVALLSASAGARASLVPNGELAIGAPGFGSTYPLITIQEPGSWESGAIGISGGAMVALTPGIANGSVFLGNYFTNEGGNTFGPLTDARRFGIPTLGSLGWTSGRNVNLLFNASEAGSDGLSIIDVTLKFYDGDSVIAAIDGGFSLVRTVPGEDNSGFLIVVDPDQRRHLDNNVFNQAGASEYRIALESTILHSTINGSADGPESFSAVSAIPEPGTYVMLLAGLGLMGFVGVRRNRISASRQPMAPRRRHDANAPVSME